jgi:hypothetical protein
MCVEVELRRGWLGVHARLHLLLTILLLFTKECREAKTSLLLRPSPESPTLQSIISFLYSLQI